MSTKQVFGRQTGATSADTTYNRFIYDSESLIRMWSHCRGKGGKGVSWLCQLFTQALAWSGWLLSWLWHVHTQHSTMSAQIVSAQTGCVCYLGLTLALIHATSTSVDLVLGAPAQPGSMLLLVQEYQYDVLLMPSLALIVYIYCRTIHG